MKKQTEADRYWYFTRRKVSSTIKGLRVDALRCRLNGPKVLLNSIPKAGTNMIEKTMGSLPGLRCTAQRTLRGWDEIDNRTMKKIRGIKRGQFGSAHLPAHESLLSVVEEYGIKVVLMIRDPRDIAVSYIKYVTSIDSTHPAHNFFCSLPDDDGRLMAVIRGVDRVVSPLAETLKKFEGWLENRALIVRFEDLIGSQGGGSDERQYETVKAIVNHLSLNLMDEQIRLACKSTYSTKTLTFRSGVTRNWKSYFKQHHVDALKESAAQMIIRYGYEKDDNW